MEIGLVPFLRSDGLRKVVSSVPTDEVSKPESRRVTHPIRLAKGIAASTKSWISIVSLRWVTLPEGMKSALIIYRSSQLKCISSGAVLTTGYRKRGHTDFVEFDNGSNPEIPSQEVIKFPRETRRYGSK